ncbi:MULTISPECIES: heavy-metal-associated domain-containing protein [unclassified Neisseria]|uniref:heavy-metal-associated domain-containing protein n=1 Tax=unclassified Neisseria TaxID=2623750 RepID=UPI002666D21F|nr:MULTISPECIES: cation transporter [unclassified Neisseria]MDO1510909.1 cation transporter [Neisseria sp. MVDL19-042950]MDO1517199.1 cation transporter [Neisseria sp. MVDL18-041461]MDO1564532.1 cation transporter [Neisseria sp. MVDL20-010259]
METINIKIGGMTCGGCVKSVTKVLETLNGVAKAEVDLASASARITFNPAEVQTAALVEAIEDAGFDAAL